MPGGRASQLTKQRGEYLVAAELASRGLLVATFSGNVPDFDLVAERADGSTVLVQVKAIAGPSWQFKIDDFAQITHVDEQQILADLKTAIVPEIIWVMVQFLDGAIPRYWILPRTEMQAIIVDGYKTMLAKHDGRRPKQWSSHHTAVWPKQLVGHEDCWALITAVPASIG